MGAQSKGIKLCLLSENCKRDDLTLYFQMVPQRPPPIPIAAASVAGGGPMRSSAAAAAQQMQPPRMPPPPPPRTTPLQRPAPGGQVQRPLAAMPQAVLGPQVSEENISCVLLINKKEIVQWALNEEMQKDQMCILSNILIK